MESLFLLFHIKYHLFSMTDLPIKLYVAIFIDSARSIPVIDVRSPKEFLQGHIPGAVNLPLFSDEERAVVGTTYTKKGKDAALLAGLDFVGPKMVDFVKIARKHARNNEVLVHCWRGGMRSEAMAWLFRFAGLQTSVLEGGYKAYRRFIRESLAAGPELIVLGGMTGSGKTELLHFLEEQGEQVLDLEALANHKGSAFGALGQSEQPTNEQFENDLAAKWLTFDPDKPVWLEDESLNIGKVIIPEVLFQRMSKAPLVLIDVPFEDRIERLTLDYGTFDVAALAEILQKISRRIGNEMAGFAIDALNAGDVKTAVSTVLRYYDKTYEYGLSKRNFKDIKKVNFAEFRKVFAELRWKIETGNWKLESINLNQEPGTWNLEH